MALLLLPSIYLLIRAAERPDIVERLLRPSLWLLIGRTLGLALAVTLASMLIAVPLAWLTIRTDLPLRRLWLTLAVLPLTIPSYVGAYLYVSALGPRGLLQQLLEDTTGITRFPSIYGFPGAVLALTLLCYPYLFLSIRTTLERFDPALEEAARLLGHTTWATFRSITLPHLLPGLGVGSLLVGLYTLRDFGAVAIMRFDTFTRVIYTQYRSFDRSQAALYALILVALTIICLVLELRLHGQARYYRSNGTARQPTQIKLGRWRWPALLFCASVVLFALVLPTGVLLYWLVRGLRAGESLSLLGPATQNTLAAAGAGALLTVLMALPIAVLAVRQPSPLTRLLDRLSYSAYALPGIAVALALVFFGITYARPLYQTFWMLLVAYAILFFPQASGILRSALLQISPRLEEAARTLGAGPLVAFLSVTIPLLRPGLLNSISLVFLTAIKELPATLILAPIGFRTLATEVWSAVSEAFFARAAAPALLIMLLTTIPLALISRWASQPSTTQP